MTEEFTKHVLCFSVDSLQRYIYSCQYDFNQQQGLEIKNDAYKAWDVCWRLIQANRALRAIPRRSPVQQAQLELNIAELKQQNLFKLKGVDMSGAFDVGKS